MNRTFGDILGIYEGDSFENRVGLSISKVHKPLQAGISGSENEGADSIVVSGGYEDDEDYGDLIIYTGQGGRSNNSKVQVADQTLTRQNKALVISCENGFPIRVIRGANKKSKFAPESGYRYDGLFRVEEYWKEKGKSNFIIWRFRLTKLNDNVNNSNIIQEPELPYEKPNRIETLIQRIVRDTYISKKVKELYNYHCQICNERIETTSGFYAEAAHIKPLGTPHNGPDIVENILCLCPNHHVMFDYGGISIDKNYTIVGLNQNKKLIKHESHNINIEYLEYHFLHFYTKS